MPYFKKMELRDPAAITDVHLGAPIGGKLDLVVLPALGWSNWAVNTVVLLEPRPVVNNVCYICMHQSRCLTTLRMATP